MTLSIAFWVIYLIALIFSWREYAPPAGQPWRFAWLIVFLLIGILGWGVFGPVIK
jgi:hypothetical protein